MFSFTPVETGFTEHVQASEHCDMLALCWSWNKISYDPLLQKCSHTYPLLWHKTSVTVGRHDGSALVLWQTDRHLSYQSSNLQRDFLFVQAPLKDVAFVRLLHMVNDNLLDSAHTDCCQCNLTWIIKPGRRSCFQLDLKEQRKHSSGVSVSGWPLGFARSLVEIIIYFFPSHPAAACSWVMSLLALAGSLKIMSLWLEFIIRAGALCPSVLQKHFFSF